MVNGFVRLGGIKFVGALNLVKEFGRSLSSCLTCGALSNHPSPLLLPLYKK